MRADANLTVRPRVRISSQAELDEIIDAHRRFELGESGGVSATLRYAQVQDRDFSGRMLRHADLTGADLTRGLMVEADFEGACLRMASMRDVDARRGRFVGADMRGVSLRRADLTGAILDEADLSQALLSLSPEGGYNLTPGGSKAAEAGQISFEVDFTGCTMRRAQLAGVKLHHANFSDALMDHVNLRGADLTGAKLDGAVLTGADLAGARIDDNALARCVMSPTPAAVQRAQELLQRLEAAELWVSSEGAKGAPAALNHEDLRPLGAAFEKRHLAALFAMGACAIGVSFGGAQLQCARFDGADLRDADFTGADLRGASFRGAKLRHARFDGAFVNPLAMASGGLQAVDLTGVDIVPGQFKEVWTH